MILIAQVCDIRSPVHTLVRRRSVSPHDDARVFFDRNQQKLRTPDQRALCRLSLLAADLLYEMAGRKSETTSRRLTTLLRANSGFHYTPNHDRCDSQVGAESLKFALETWWM